MIYFCTFVCVYVHVGGSTILIVCKKRKNSNLSIHIIIFLGFAEGKCGRKKRRSRWGPHEEFCPLPSDLLDPSSIPAGSRTNAVPCSVAVQPLPITTATTVSRPPGKKFFNVHNFHLSLYLSQWPFAFYMAHLVGWDTDGKV